MDYLNSIREWFKDYPVLGDFALFAAIIILSFIAYLIINRIFIRIIHKLASKSKTELDDYIVKSKALQYFSFLLPLIIIYNTSRLFPDFDEAISTICDILIIFFIVRSITTLFRAFNAYYETKPRSKERPIKGYIQVVNIFLYIFASVYLFAVVTGQTPWAVLSALGALTAVLLLIFKDTILSFVAGIQITSYDLIHVGDWISMPQYGADGDVIDIALHTIKIQNWDKTISVIPTYKFTENSYKNWRGMTESGGRRIKRSLHIDQNSIKFLSDSDLESLSKIHLLKPYLEEKQKILSDYNKQNKIDPNSLVNGRRLTNIGTFRAYAEAYLAHHPQLNQEMTKMIRQLAPTPQGLPIEIYAFTSTIDWLPYEAIQGDIFDHLIAVVNAFDLQIFQDPTGMDFQKGLPDKH